MFKDLKPSEYTVEPYKGSKAFNISFSNGQSSSSVKLLEGKDKNVPFYEDEEKNQNGTYKRGVFALVNHLYYKHPSTYEKLGVWDHEGIDFSHFHKKHTDKIWIIKIPRGLYGERILPGSVSLSFNSGASIIDDSKGNAIANNGAQIGNIFYQNGLIVFSSSIADPSITNFKAFKSEYKDRSVSNRIDLNEFSEFDLKFKNVAKFFEYNARCVIDPHEFNSTVNPTAYDSAGLPGKYRNDKNFSSYITTIGLYDAQNTLVAVAKLPKPVRKPSAIPLTIQIKFDL